MKIYVLLLKIFAVHVPKFFYNQCLIISKRLGLFPQEKRKKKAFSQALKVPVTRNPNHIIVQTGDLKGLHFNSKHKYNGLKINIIAYNSSYYHNLTPKQRLE